MAGFGAAAVSTTVLLERAYQLKIKMAAKKGLWHEEVL